MSFDAWSCQDWLSGVRKEGRAARSHFHSSEPCPGSYRPFVVVENRCCQVSDPSCVYERARASKRRSSRYSSLLSKHRIYHLESNFTFRVLGDKRPPGRHFYSLTASERSLKREKGRIKTSRERGNKVLFSVAGERDALHRRVGCFSSLPDSQIFIFLLPGGECECRPVI